jgi:hypothetical protein
MDKIDIGLVFQSKTQKNNLNNMIEQFNDKIKSNISGKRKKTIRKLKKSYEKSILSEEQKDKYNKYIDSIFEKYSTNIIKTYDSHFNIHQKNMIHHEIIDIDSLNKIIIRGRYNKPYFGKLIDLTDIILDININDTFIKYHKL